NCEVREENALESTFAGCAEHRERTLVVIDCIFESLRVVVHGAEVPEAAPLGHGGDRLGERQSGFVTSARTIELADLVMKDAQVHPQLAREGRIAVGEVERAFELHTRVRETPPELQRAAA